MRDFILVGLVIALLYVTVTAQHQTGHTEYVILFDAGSSGTRMSIYQFLDSGPSLKPSDVKELDPSLSKVKPGISEFADDPSQVEAYMMPLLESAKKTIPQDKQSSTPIYLLATAGMRLVPTDQANAILDEVRKLFHDKAKCPFLFQEDVDVRIISGTAEGIYSWITVNFLTGIFGTNQASYGSLDLGGASHQNAWNLKRKKNPETFSISVAGKTYDVFARSYLGYGQDEAKERYLESIVKKSDCTENAECAVKSPCHNKGFKESLEFNGQARVFEGTAQVEICEDIIRNLFFCRSLDLKKCPFSNQPRLRGKFYGFSALYYVLTDINAVCSDCQNNFVNPKKIKRHLKSFCGKNYDEINESSYSKSQCFGANYIYELLTEGYRLKPGKKIRIANSLNGFDLDWKMGAVLHNAKILDIKGISKK